MEPSKRNKRYLRSKRNIKLFTDEEILDKLNEVNDAKKKEEKLDKNIDKYWQKLDLLEEDNKLKEERLNKFSKKNKLKNVLKKHYIEIGSGLIAVLVMGASFQFGSVYGKHNSENNQLVYDSSGTLLTSDTILNSLLSNSQNQSVVMTQIVNKLLKNEYGLTKEQAKQVDESIKRVKSQLGDYYKASLVQKGYNEQTYKMTVENQIIVKDQILKTYKPTKEQIKTKYDEIENRYKIYGIYVTPANEKVTDDELNKQTDSILNKLRNNELTFKNASKIKNDNVVTSGIGLDGNTLNDEINSNNYASLSNTIRNELNKHNENDYIIIKNLQYGNVIIKIDKIKKKQPLKKEQTKLIKEIKKLMSTNDDQQVLFIKKLLEKNKVRSNNTDIENIIKTSLS